MTSELEKEIARLNALIAVQDDEIMHLLERLLEAHSDAQRDHAQNSRLRQENERLREQIIHLETR